MTAFAEAASLEATVPVTKTRWQRFDDILGVIVHVVVIGGGVFAPFLLYLYALLFR